MIIILQTVKYYIIMHYIYYCDYIILGGHY
jgi:hypothetical protein